MAAFLDACRFNPTLGGTTDWTYSSAVTGYNSPALAGVINARVYKYRAEDSSNTQWEMGEGSYNTGTGVLARTTVLFNSSGTGTASGQSGAGTKISFSSVPQVAIVALKEDLLSIEEANAFTAAQQLQARANLYAAPLDAMASTGMQINGGMEVSQENSSTQITLTNNTAKYAVDQFVGFYNHTAATAVVKMQQVTPPGSPAFGTAFPKCLQIIATTLIGSANVADIGYVYTPTEGYRWSKLGFGNAAASSVTIGFWIYSTSIVTLTLSVRNSALNRSYVSNFSVTAANTWEYKTITVPGDTSGTWLADSGIGALIAWCVCGNSGGFQGTNNTWNASNAVATSSTLNALGLTNGSVYLTGVTITPGSDAPLASSASRMARSFDQEFTLTQRYYQSIAPGVINAEFITGGMSSAIQGFYPIRLNGVMRAIPTCSVSAASDWNNNPFVNLASIQPGTSAQFAGQSTFGFRLGITSASTGVPSPFGQLSVLDAVNTSAKIIADARL